MHKTIILTVHSHIWLTSRPIIQSGIIIIVIIIVAPSRRPLCFNTGNERLDTLSGLDLLECLLGLLELDHARD